MLRSSRARTRRSRRRSTNARISVWRPVKEAPVESESVVRFARLRSWEMTFLSSEVVF